MSRKLKEFYDVGDRIKICGDVYLISQIDTNH